VHKRIEPGKAGLYARVREDEEKKG